MGNSMEGYDQGRLAVQASLKAGTVVKPAADLDDLELDYQDTRLTDLVHDRYDALSSLVQCASRIKSLTTYINDRCEQARLFVSGEPALFNDLGVLQSSGVELDLQCGRFGLLTEQAIKAEARLHDYLNETYGRWLAR